MNNEGLAVSFIRKNRSAQLFGYIQINVLNPLKRYNRSAEILVSKIYIQYLKNQFKISQMFNFNIIYLIQ